MNSNLLWCGLVRALAQRSHGGGARSLHHRDCSPFVLSGSELGIRSSRRLFREPIVDIALPSITVLPTERKGNEIKGIVKIGPITAVRCVVSPEGVQLQCATRTPGALPCLLDCSLLFSGWGSVKWIPFE